MSKVNPFEHVKSVWNTKEYLIDNRELFLKEYSPFIVNRALSNSEIGVFFANEMNRYSIDSDIQYDFYFYGIPKQRSYLKWSKKGSGEFVESDVELIQELYDLSYVRAVEYLSLINTTDLDSLRKLKGGK